MLPLLGPLLLLLLVLLLLLLLLMVKFPKTLNFS